MQQQLTIGTLLRGGTYRIEKVLGQGSFGITYLAVHVNLGKKVAIKEFFMRELNSRGDDGSITGMTDGSLSHNYYVKFQKEAINLSQLDHPNIVRVTDSFSENGTFYYVMDFIEGQNLNDYVKSHHVDEAEAVSIIKSVADALIYMHEEKHMLHLDLKPGNVMRRESDGHIFLIDFGLSKHFDTNGQPETSTTIGLGTEGYAPIEQGNRAKNGEFHATIDVYALGATLYKLLTRETPPPASVLVSDNELLIENLNNKKISQRYIDVTSHAMSPNVRKRTQSVREFVIELQASSSTRPSFTQNVKTTIPEEDTIISKPIGVSLYSQSGKTSNIQKHVSSEVNVSKKKKVKSSIKIIIALVLTFAIGVGTYITLTPSKGEKFYEAESLMEGKTIKDGKYLDADEVAALPIMQELADKGYGPAIYTLGVYYANGLASIVADSVEAEHCFKKAVPILTKEAERGDKYSQCALAILYGNGIGVKEDSKMSFYWMEKSAEQGYDDAQNNLAQMYNNGEGVATDNKKALYWLKKAAEQNHPDAAMCAALYYNLGIGVDVDSLEANKIYTKLDRMGYAPAQNCLANYYYNRGNYTKAIPLYKKAAAKGICSAQLSLSLAYLLGHGVQEDSKTAQEWAQKAVDNSDHAADAVWVLGICYERNDILNMAFECYEESANLGYPEAQYKLAVYYQQGLGGVKANQKVAEKWYKTAIANGYEE